MIWSPRYLVEPVIFLFMFNYITQMIYSYGIYQADVWYDQTKNESLVRYCLYHKTDVECKNLSENTTRQVSMFNMYLGIEYNSVGILVNLLVGYLSDRVPRTTILRAAIFSSIFTSGVLLVNALIMEMPLFIYYITVLIPYCGGGFGALIGTSMAYISDVSDTDSRTTRIAIADSMLQLGALFGTLVGGELMSHSTWYSTPLLCTCLNVILGFYVLAVIRNPPRVRKPKSQSVKEVLTQMIDVYTGKSRYRKRIYILSAAYLLHFTAFLAYAGFFINYLLNPPFGWDADKIGIISTISSVGNFAMVLTVPLLKKASVPETLIAGVSCILCCAGFGVAAVARTFVLMAIANLLKAGSGIALAIYRARLSKLVKPTQYGQLFMILNSCECVATLISSVGIYQVYLGTRKWFTGFAFLILLVLEVIALVLTLWDGWLAKQQGMSDDNACSDDSEDSLLITPDDNLNELIAPDDNQLITPDDMLGTEAGPESQAIN